MITMSSRETGCLTCGNEDARFESEDHIIPAALGNTVKSGLVKVELVVPPGEVCDKCNRRRLRDRALVEWPPISIFRSLAQIRNRRGNLVDAVEGTAWNIVLNRHDPRQLRLEAQASTNAASGRDDVARALCKIALETRWLQDGEDARSRRWDEVAAAAIGGPLPEGLAIGLTQPADPADIDLTPFSDVLVADDPGVLRVACHVSVVGLGLLLVIRSEPPALPRTAWWRLDPATGSLRGPNSMWAHFSGMAERAVRSTSRSRDVPSGQRSRLPTQDQRVQIQVIRSSS